jgi:hypothetical protein
MNKLLKALSNFVSPDKKIGPSYDDFSGDVYNFAYDPEARPTLADKTPYEQPSELTAGMMGGMPPPEIPQPEQVPNVVVEPSQQIMGGVEVNPNVQGGMPRPPLPVREAMPSPSLEMPGGPRMQSVADQVIQDLTAKIGTDINKDAQKALDDELAGTLSSFGYGAGNLFGGVGVVPSISPQSDRLPPSQLPGVDYSIEGVESLFSGAGPDATFERVPPRTNTDILITPEENGYVDEITQSREQQEQAEYGSMDMPSGGREPITIKEKVDQNKIDSTVPDSDSSQSETIQNKTPPNFIPKNKNVNINYYWQKHNNKKYGVDATKAAKPFQAIVLHHDLGGLNKSKLDYYGTFDKDRDGQFGYHFAIDDEGNIYQTAPLNKRTNHIRWGQVSDDLNKQFVDQGLPVLSNSNTIGIAYLGTGTSLTISDKLTEKAKQSYLKLIRELKDQFGDLPYLTHGDLDSRKRETEGEPVSNFLDSNLNEINTSTSKFVD